VSDAGGFRHSPVGAHLDPAARRRRLLGEGAQQGNEVGVAETREHA
jgi:hypothetical protein